MNTLSHTFAVIGATGAMGIIAAQDLYWSHRGNQLVLIGRDTKKLRALSRKFPGKRVRTLSVDITDERRLAQALRGVSVVLNCAQYELNLAVMRACLLAGAHYVDLGGLFHMTRKQLKLHMQFRKKGLLAVLGMGAAPGITNLLAVFAAQKLDRVSEIHIRVGSWDGTRYTGEPPLSSSYSLQTIFEEFSYRPAVFTKGRFQFTEPMSGFEEQLFPKPVGRQRPMFTIHSEVATLPIYFRAKGIREVSFKIAFDDDFVRKVSFLRAIGMTGEEPIAVHGQKVVPRDFFLAMAKIFSKPVRVGPVREYEVLRAIVKGKRHGKATTIVADCHVRGMPAWNMGVDTDTGVPPSIVAQMIATGVISARGSLPPEHCVPLAPFFRELRRRRMTVRLH